MKRLMLIVLILGVAACKQHDQVGLHFIFDKIDPSEVSRLETLVDVDPSDGRMFYADQPFREVAVGVGYEVRDVDGSGRRKVLISHDEALGYVFTPAFLFTLLPPISGTAPKLTVSTGASGVAGRIGSGGPVTVVFTGGKTSVDIVIKDERCGGRACNADEVCCGTTCVNPIADPANCGMCGMTCAGTQSCAGGTCLCEGGSACTSNEKCCVGAGCLDLQNDPFHCGDCNTACRTGETCAAGKCQCNGGAGCNTSSICCGAAGCKAGNACDCNGSSCTAPSQCCGGTQCLDVTTDAANCGMCGKSCPSGFGCTGGNCTCVGKVCSAGNVCCTTGCSDTQTDVRNCGACGVACGASETCQGGSCKCGANPGCQAGQTCCGSTCVDTTVSNLNCGGCNISCGANEQCVSGKCSCGGNAACVGGQACCSTASGGATCADVTSDSANCGSCGHGCATGEICQNKVCTPNSGGCSPACMNGNTCVGGVCVCAAATGGTGPSGAPPSICAPADVCCNGICTDLHSDPSNCGQCGKGCGGDKLCCNAACVGHDKTNCAACGAGCGGAQRCCACGGGTGFSCATLCLGTLVCL